MQCLHAIDNLRQALENHLHALPYFSQQKNRVWKAAQYALFNGGKRIRPLIVLALMEALSGSFEKGLDAASALEMVHTYSLIHDDLPAMDNDDFRRGKPTVHKAFDEATAILSGDLLLTLAFEVIAQSSALTDYEKAQAIRHLSSHAGGEGMILGQMLDIENDPISEEGLIDIYQKKTGALFKTAFWLGAFLAGLPLEKAQGFGLIGQQLGLAFQIIDDTLDVTAPEKKKRFSDKKNHKKTFVHFHDIEESKTMAKAIVDESLSRLQQENQSCSIIIEICTSLVNRTV